MKIYASSRISLFLFPRHRNCCHLSWKLCLCSCLPITWRCEKVLTSTGRATWLSRSCWSDACRYAANEFSSGDDGGSLGETYPATVLSIILSFSRSGCSHRSRDPPGLSVLPLNVGSCTLLGPTPVASP